MIEKVNKFHPDKQADRIAGALIDYAYDKSKTPKVAVEVLIGHGYSCVMIESSVNFKHSFVKDTVKRISAIENVKIVQVEQDKQLSDNQIKGYRCGDNGVFRAKWSEEYEKATAFAKKIAAHFPHDGKYLFDFKKRTATICQSNATKPDILNMYGLHRFENIVINPLGDWIGGTNTDSGCTNRKLGSDQPLCNPNGLHGKDLSKADVSLTIYTNYLSRVNKNKLVTAYCSIGDEVLTVDIDGVARKCVRFEEVIHSAEQYIQKIGGFERFAEYGIV